MRNAEFERFVDTNLGDVAVWDKWKECYISPKIRLYLQVWNLAASKKPTVISLLLANVDDCNHYTADSGPFSISRMGNLITICKHFGHIQ